MILWCDGLHGPAENMRRDTCLLERAERGGEPVLRLFGFAPAGITLGRSQDPARELDLPRCAADGVGWAIRPTGGRAVFHEQEWTFSLTAPLDDPSWGGSPGHAYARVCATIVTSLAALGVPAAFAEGARAAGAEPGRHRGVAAPCFSSTARHEIVIQGRKLVGIAQRRTARALVQQGSLLLGDGHARLPEYLALPDHEREPMRRRLVAASATCAPWLGANPPLERWAATLLDVLPTASRLDAAAGAFLLTASAQPSYTDAAT